MIKQLLAKFFAGTGKQDWEEHTIECTPEELGILTKAIQFYIFTRHKKLDHLPSELAERLSHAGHVAYSLIITFLNERNFKVDYMQYLNDELKTLYQLNEPQRAHLDIQPEEIDQIELQDPLKLYFQDDETDTRYQLVLLSAKGVVKIKHN